MTTRGAPRGPMRVMLWCARAGALASSVVVAVVGLHLAREAGIRFRWEVDGGSGRSAVAREVPRSAREARPGRPEAEPIAPAAGRSPPAREMGGGDGTRARGPGAAIRIDFEAFPDGSPGCAPCALSDQFETLGVRFTFRSWATGSPRPHLVEVGEFSAPGEAGDHAVAPAYREEKGLEVGVVAMEFPGRPPRVVFELTGPDLIPRFRVTAWTAAGRIESAEIPRAASRPFQAVGGGRFRRETVVVESAAGIERIELDGRGPPGHVLLVDDLFLGTVGAESVDSAAGRSSPG